jgi:hypothetical protein
MKHVYLKLIIISAVLIIFSSTVCYAQCPWGFVASGVAYDTTVTTGSGNYSTQFKFPKFDPQNGMVVCVKLCVTITGRVSMYLENNVTAPTTYNISYYRNDTLSGPALSSPLTSYVFAGYGPYDLAASDGVPFSGPDFMSIGPDTILQAVSMCRTITDTADLSQFYGLDSVTYNYSINANAIVTGSGDYLFSVATTGIVNYRLEYCYCPAWILPVNVHQFDLNKKANDKVELRWTGSDDGSTNYHYEIEVSNDGHNFSSVGSVQKNSTTDNYDYLYAVGAGNRGVYFFRIKQIWTNGYTRFSEVKSMALEKSTLPGYTIYPNPSSGIVGIKFDNILSGKILVLISNAQGQTVTRKEIEVSGPSYRQIATLPRGVYWLKMTDVTSHLSCVNQLFIK